MLVAVFTGGAAFVIVSPESFLGVGTAAPSPLMKASHSEKPKKKEARAPY